MGYLEIYKYNNNLVDAKIYLISCGWESNFL